MERENLLSAIKNIPNIEVAYRELSQSIAMTPMLGETFWARDEQRRIEESAGFRDWKPRHSLEKAYYKPPGTSSTLATAIFADSEAREVIEADTNLEETVGRLNSGRASLHLTRMLTHQNAPAVRAFACSYLKYCKDVERTIFEQVIPTRGGNEMSQFWTVAPYLFHSLYKRGAYQNGMLLWRC